MDEERETSRQQQQAAARANEERIAGLKVEAEEQLRSKAVHAESERNRTLQAAENEFANRFKYYQAGTCWSPQVS